MKHMSHHDLVLENGVTYNIHPSVIVLVDRFSVGDLIRTTEGNVGLITKEHDTDAQGFRRYEVIIDGKKFYYTSLEMDFLEKK